jgi:hypothetical protein
MIPSQTMSPVPTNPNRTIPGGRTSPRGRVSPIRTSPMVPPIRKSLIPTVELPKSRNAPTRRLTNPSRRDAAPELGPVSVRELDPARAQVAVRELGLEPAPGRGLASGWGPSDKGRQAMEGPLAAGKVDRRAPEDKADTTEKAMRRHPSPAGGAADNEGEPRIPLTSVPSRADVLEGP